MLSKGHVCNGASGPKTGLPGRISAVFPAFSRVVEHTTPSTRCCFNRAWSRSVWLGTRANPGHGYIRDPGIPRSGYARVAGIPGSRVYTKPVYPGSEHNRDSGTYDSQQFTNLSAGRILEVLSRRNLIRRYGLALGGWVGLIGDGSVAVWAQDLVFSLVPP